MRSPGKGAGPKVRSVAAKGCQSSVGAASGRVLPLPLHLSAALQPPAAPSAVQAVAGNPQPAVLRPPAKPLAPAKTSSLGTATRVSKMSKSACQLPSRSGMSRVQPAAVLASVAAAADAGTQGKQRPAARPTTAIGRRRSAAAKQAAQAAVQPRVATVASNLAHTSSVATTLQNSPSKGSSNGNRAAQVLPNVNEQGQGAANPHADRVTQTQGGHDSIESSPLPNSNTGKEGFSTIQSRVHAQPACNAEARLHL